MLRLLTQMRSLSSQAHDRQTKRSLEEKMDAILCLKERSKDHSLENVIVALNLIHPIPKKRATKRKALTAAAKRKRAKKRLLATGSKDYALPKKVVGGKTGVVTEVHDFGEEDFEDVVDENGVGKYMPTATDRRSAGICTTCSTQMLSVARESTMVCPKCFVSEPFVDMSSMSTSSPYLNMDQRQNPFRHKRSVKITDFINHICARQRQVVPDSRIIEIAVEVHKKFSVTTTSDITLAMIRETMKGMRCDGILDHAMHIYCRIVGCAPPRLSTKAEEMLHILFVLIQEPWERLRPTPSTPFFSTPYAILVLCRYAGFTEIEKFVCLRKSRQSLVKQQTIMKSVFDDLKWTNFPFLTDEEKKRF